MLYTNIPRFSLKAFLVLEKNILNFFLPYMGMAAILFNGQVQVSEKKIFKDYSIFIYEYSPGAWADNPWGDKILIVLKKFYYFNQTL